MSGLKKLKIYGLKIRVRYYTPATFYIKKLKRKSKQNVLVGNYISTLMGIIFEIKALVDAIKSLKKM